jgi:hypothetical protein
MFVNLFEAHAPYHVVPVQFRRAFAPSGVSLHQLEIVGTLGFLAQIHGDIFPRRFDQHLTDVLDGAISTADSYLSQLIDAAGEDMVIIVLSDHGDLIGEHNFHGHGLALWEPLIHIPLVLAGPGIPAGVSLDDPVSIMDVMPTVLGMADLRAPALPGEDLRKCIAGDRKAGRIIYAQQFQASRLIPRGWGRHHSPATIRNLQSRKTAGVLGTWKRIVIQDGTDVTFDLVSDPAELHPKAMVGVSIPVHLPRPGARRGAQREIDPDTKAALRALGYIR